MATSDNGYVVLDKDTTGSHPRLRLWRVPTVGRQLLLRDGSCGFLLVHLAYWFDQQIERLDIGPLDDWGWSPRKISGTNRYSNHASGTAMDLNASKHPMGRSGTFSTKEQAEIRGRLKLYNGCIRWGGDYRTRKDEMHFEIVEDLATVVKRAQQLCDSPRGRRILEDNKGVREIIF